MSEQRGRLQRQIEELQKQLADQRSQIKGLSQRLGVLGRRPQVRIAETVAGTGGYPTEDSGFTAFNIRFRDADFIETEGIRMLQGFPLDDSSQRIGLTIPGVYIPEGTDVFVVESDGKHYIIGTTSTEGAKDTAGDCLCALMTLLKSKSNLSDITASEWAAVQQTCKCSATCEVCLDDIGPKEWSTTIAGASPKYAVLNLALNVTNSQLDDIVAAVNGTHVMPFVTQLIGGSGYACIWRKDVTVVSGGDEFLIAFEAQVLSNVQTDSGLDGEAFVSYLNTDDAALRFCIKMFNGASNSRFLLGEDRRYPDMEIQHDWKYVPSPHETFGNFDVSSPIVTPFIFMYVAPSWTGITSYTQGGHIDHTSLGSVTLTPVG